MLMLYLLKYKLRSNKSDLRIYVASLLAASSLKEIQIRHSGISIKKRDICTCYWNVATYKWKIDFISLLIKASFLTDLHFKFLGVGLDIKYAYLYLSFLLFQVQQDRPTKIDWHELFIQTIMNHIVYCLQSVLLSQYYCKNEHK